MAAPTHGKTAENKAGKHNTVEKKDEKNVYRDRDTHR
jgi:hypothetical protein